MPRDGLAHTSGLFVLWVQKRNFTANIAGRREGVRRHSCCVRACVRVRENVRKETNRKRSLMFRALFLYCTKFWSNEDGRPSVGVKANADRARTRTQTHHRTLTLTLSLTPTHQNVPTSPKCPHFGSRMNIIVTNRRKTRTDRR